MHEHHDAHASLDDELDADETAEDELDASAAPFDADDEPHPAAASGSGRPMSEAGAELVRFVEYMASNLVDDPARLEIRPENFGQAIHIKLVVPEEEMGKVIGRQGRIARSMRTLLTIAAARKGLRASLDIDS